MANMFKSREKSTISNSLRDALIYLNSQTIEEGKLYSRRYFTSPSKTKVDVVLAYGVLNGVGPTCYSVISESEKIVVWGVSNSLPDVSSVAQGQLYIYWDSAREVSYLVYLTGDSRVVDPVQFPMMVFNTADNHLYYISPNLIVDVYEHLEEVSVLEERISYLEEAVEALLNGSGGNTTTPAPTPGPGEDDDDTTTTTTSTTTTTTTPNPVTPLKINSFNMDTTEEHESGENLNIMFTWAYNIPVTSQSINNDPIDPSLREFMINGITSDTTFTLRASDGNTSANKSVSVKFSPKTFMGGGRTKAADITSDNFYEVFSGDSVEEGYSNIVCNGKTTKTFTFAQKSYVLLAFPKDKCANLQIKDLNNFDVTFHTNEVTVTNSYGEQVIYVVYQSPAASTELTFVFIF